MVFFLRNQALILLVDFWNDTGLPLVEMASKNCRSAQISFESGQRQVPVWKSLLDKLVRITRSNLDSFTVKPF